MFIRLLLTAFLLHFATGELSAGFIEREFIKKNSSPLPPSIKVLIVHDQPGVILEVKGKYKIYDPYSDKHLSTRFTGKRKYIQAITDGLKWGEEFPDLHQLRITPDNPEVTTLVNGIEYKGNIYVYDIGGTISIVNEPDIEDYLYSTLSIQKPDVNSPEALAAKAIVARTNAYYLVANPKTKFWAVDGQQVGYKGYAVIDLKNPFNSAIDATRYIILSRNGSDADEATPFPAFWISEANSAGGEKTISRISLSSVETMAQRGDHAAQILAKAFPNSSLVPMHYSSSKGNAQK